MKKTHTGQKLFEKILKLILYKN